MVRNSRREFLGEVGRGMLVASLGAGLVADLGLRPAMAAESDTALDFGQLEPLVALMQDTEPARLTAILIERLQAGTDLKTLVAAGALANARTFGGQDYIGFHTFMALAPAYRMAQQLPSEQRALPVLKVLYRNASRIQDFGGRASELLHEIEPESLPTDVAQGPYLQEVARRGDVAAADRAFAALRDLPVGEAFNHVQFAVQDEVDVHRVVLAWRAMDTLDLAGAEWGHCMLRQSIRYCASVEKAMIDRDRPRSPIRGLLPTLLDQYRLLGRPLGQRVGDDAWLLDLATIMYAGTREQAADAAAQALAEGFSPDSIGEALSLASNMLVLHDPGRPEEWSNREKPAGSCHGDSVGVHASDAANAWRHIARVSDPRNTVASLIVGAFHTAGQSGRSNTQPYPLPEQLAQVREDQPAALLHEAEAAIRAQDQFRAAAVIARYGQLGFDPQAVCNLMLQFATSEDGALHAEKYYNTVCDEFASMRPAFRWNQLVALARVTASQYGFRSPGFEEAKRILG